MSWEQELSCFLSDADGSVSKIRERLISGRRFTTAATAAAVAAGGVSPASFPLKVPHLLRQPSSSSSSCLGVQWSDLAAVQSQLHMQSQVIESLKQKVHDMERERQSQKRLIQSLHEEVHRLREGDSWRTEMGRELSSLRGHITRATSLGNLEESFSLQLCRDEVEQLRREVDKLKTQLRRQEGEDQETRKQQQHNCRALDQLTERHTAHSTKLTDTLSQCVITQQEIQHIRSSLSQLKDEFRRLTLRETTHTAGNRIPTLTCTKVKGDSSTESSPTPSLAEVSSDDLSWLQDQGHREPSVRVSVGSRQSDLAAPGSDLDDDGDNEEDDFLDEDVDLDFGSDLSLNDL